MFYYQGGAAAAFKAGMHEDLAVIDGRKISGNIQTVADKGSAVLDIDLKAEYGEITVENGKLVLDGDFHNAPRKFYLPSQLDYSGNVSGSEVCIKKHAYSVTLTAPPCSREQCTPGTCRTRGSGAPDSGYICKGGVYTDDDFFTRYYRHCSNPGEEFIEINTVSCPDEVTSGGAYGCRVSATWRCDDAGGDGELALTVDGSQEASRSIPCTDEIEHGNVGATLSLSSGSYTVSGSGSAGSANAQGPTTTLTVTG